MDGPKSSLDKEQILSTKMILAKSYTGLQFFWFLTGDIKERNEYI